MMKRYTFLLLITILGWILPTMAFAQPSSTQYATVNTGAAYGAYDVIDLPDLSVYDTDASTSCGTRWTRYTYETTTGFYLSTDKKNASFRSNATAGTWAINVIKTISHSSTNTGCGTFVTTAATMTFYHSNMPFFGSDTPGIFCVDNTYNVGSYISNAPHPAIITYKIGDAGTIQTDLNWTVTTATPSPSFIGAYVEYANRTIFFDHTFSVRNLDFTFNALPSRCSTDGGIDLQSYTTQTTTFSGPGISGSIFYPAQAGLGTHTITAVNSQVNCSSVTKTQTITVYETPVVYWNTVPAQCTYNGAVYLGTYFGSSVSGGSSTYSGTGVSGSYFYPSTAGAGSHTITGSQTVNGCSDSETVVITVYSPPSFTFDALPAICTDGGALNLQPYTSITTSFSGTGVSGSYFYPGTAGGGTHTITASATSNGCTTTKTQTITVTTDPVVSAGADMKVAQSQTMVYLSGSPTGGSWSGSPYVTSTGAFTPSEVGTYYLTYSYSTGPCSGTDEMVLTVVAVDAPSASASTSPCYGGGDITFYASGASSGQIYRWYTDPSGGTPFHTTPFFTEFIPTTTTYYVSVYDESVNVESGRTSVTGVVKDAVPVPVITGETSACGISTINLNASNGVENAEFDWYESESSTSRLFSGADISLTVDKTTTVWVESYDPAKGCLSERISYTITYGEVPYAPEGESVVICGGGEATLTARGADANETYSWYEVQYGGLELHSGSTYTTTVTSDRYFYVSKRNLNTGCESPRIKLTIDFRELPVVAAGTSMTSCYYDPEFALTGGSPTSGQWSGPGVVSSTYFKASLAGEGTHTLTYSYTDEYGCSNSATRTVTVLPAPNTPVTENVSICGEGSVVLTASGANGELGEDYFWYEFSSSTAQIGQGEAFEAYANFSTTYYVAIRASSGCESPRKAVKVTVIDLPAAPVAQDVSRCGKGEVTLTASGAPADGGIKWFESENSDIVYHEGPSFVYYAEASRSFFVAAYNSSGCLSERREVAVTVGANINVDAGPDFNICKNEERIYLSDGSPAGGFWTGEGVGGNYFDPSGVAAGEIILTYTYQGTYCTTSDTRIARVYDTQVVSAGPDKELCHTSNKLNLLSEASVQSATFIGNGVSGISFDPAVSGAGSHLVTMVYLNENGCESRDSRIITVIMAEEVTVGSDFYTCLSGEPVDLMAGVSKTGGVWSGSGVVNNTFDPAVAMDGQHLLTYRVPDSQGCESVATKIATVRAPVLVDAGSVLSVCQAAPMFEITGASPTGGYYQGTGVVGGTVLDPSLLPLGENMISYYYTDLYGCTYTDQRVINVVAPPVVSAGDDFERCISASPNQLVGQPTGGLWIGNGISADGVFTPELAGIGTHELFYEFEDEFSCSVMDMVVVEVLAEPAFTVGSDISLCLEAPAYNLEAAVSPVGGLFQGPGVSGSLFYASRAGVGVHEITYSYQTETGCNLSGTRSITVTEVPDLTVGADKSLCIDSPSLDLNADGVSHAGGRWSGPGVLGSSFYPSTVETGSHTVTYTVEFNGCSNSVERVIDVNEPPVLDLGAETEIICQQSGLLNLAQFPNISGGVWEGSGVEGNFLNVNNLQPGYYALIYRIDDYLGCTLNKSKGFQVVESPALTFTDVPKSLCVHAQAINLNKYVNLTGGIFEGAGINGTNFTPAEAGIGLHIIEYTYTNGYGCSTTERQVIEVTERVDVNAGTDVSLCIGLGGYDMANHGAYPAGGIFTGTGVRNNIFDPSLSGTGNFTITYLYDHGNGCIGTDDIIITVTPSEITDFGSDEVTCINASEVILNFSTELEGGNWEGNGVVDNIFYPNLAGTGVHELTYRNENFSCEIAGKRKLSVVDLPELPIMTMESVEGCINEPVKLEAKLPEGSAQNNLQVAWFREDGTFLDYGSSIEHVVTVNENIYFSTVNRFGCESSREQFVRIIARKPSGDFYANKTQLAFGSYVKFSTEGLVNAVGFEWDFGDGTKSYERDPYKYYYASDSFDIALTLTSAAGCKTVIRKENYMVVFQEDGGEAEGFLTGISDKDIEEGSVLLYPNPVYNSFKLKFTKATVVSKMNVKVYDLLGVVHYESQIMVSSGNDEFSIDVNSLALAPGQYYVVLQSENDSETMKFIKQ